MWTSLHAFYNSKEWRELRRLLIHERADPKDGVLYCQHSGKPLVLSYDIVAHHIKPLTLANVNDYSVSLNPENILLVSQKAHNEIHARFGYCAERKVYVVWGSPCSGKTTFVNDIKGNSDLVVDMDNIWQCITGGARYEKPAALKNNAFIVRDALYDSIKTRAGKWERAFIITGGAVQSERSRLIAALGAEDIFIDTDKETCLKRLASDDNRTATQKTEWENYIHEWWSKYAAG